MEISSFNGFADLGMEDPLFMHQWAHVDSTFLDNDFHQSQYSHNNNYDHVIDFQRGAIDGHSRICDSIKPENTSGSPHPNATLYSSPRTEEEEAWCNTNSLNFSSSPLDHSIGSTNYVLKSCRGAKTVISTLSNNNNNVLAERKRREKLSQKFIALSTLVPGLKKMDKATVLGDAINHIKQLQHKVKALEDRTRSTKMESFVFVKKYKVQADDNCENSSYADDQINISSGPIMTESPLPEIEARFCDRDVLISIHCEKRKGVLEKTVAEIEKLHLSVVNSSVMSFGDSSINITLVARKDEEFNVNIKELVPNIRCALKKFM